MTSFLRYSLIEAKKTKLGEVNKTRNLDKKKDKKEKNRIISEKEKNRKIKKIDKKIRRSEKEEN